MNQTNKEAGSDADIRSNLLDVHRHVLAADFGHLGDLGVHDEVGSAIGAKAPAMKESPIMKRILLDCGHGDTRLFRANVGQAWAGVAIRQPNGVDVLVKNAYPVKFGHKGMSDLIGWRSVLVTEAMLGRKLAVYTAIEAKSTTGRPSDDQRVFIDLVLAAGGMAGVAKSVDDAQEILNQVNT